MSDLHHRILGVHVTNRLRKATDLQRVFTEFGCNIKTRLGLHEVGPGHCSPSRVILLELFGDDATCDTMRDQLKQVEGVEVQEMVFRHPG